VKELTPEALRSLLLNEEHYARLAALDPRSGLAVPLVARGRPLGALLLFSCDANRLYDDEDVRLAMLVAERTAVSLELLQSLRAARDATLARDELLAFVAHDLRNPLSAVSLTVQRMFERVPAGADEVRRGLATIARSAERASRLIQDLLDLRRPEADLTLASQPHSPQHLVAEALETQLPLVDAASLTLRIDVPDALPAVQADPDRMAQVLENLVGNAVKFTPAGGAISVGAANREHDVVFWVKDTGRGVPSMDLPHVFDPSWRAQGPQHGSLGLGLPIARRIVEAHAGHIWVESEEGAGCTVSFTLPKTVVQTPAP
jgi:signal transduction histidine kinase